MPLYEYQCAACKKVHEIMQKFSDSPMETCPECGGAVSKLISMSSFALKGTGWYTTDYKRKSSGAAPSSESAAPSPATTSPATPSVASPAATAAKPSTSDSKA